MSLHLNSYTDHEIMKMEGRVRPHPSRFARLRTYLHYGFSNTRKTEDDDDWPAEENQRSAALDNSDDERHVDRQVQEGNLCCRQPEQHRQHPARRDRSGARSQYALGAAAAG